MNNLTDLKSNWNIIKDKMLQQFSTLTEEDLTIEDGNEDELFNKLEAKLGMPKTEIYEMISQLEK
jgi:hypothetical protein